MTEVKNCRDAKQRSTRTSMMTVFAPSVILIACTLLFLLHSNRIVHKSPPDVLFLKSIIINGELDKGNCCESGRDSPAGGSHNGVRRCSLLVLNRRPLVRRESLG